MSYLLQLLILAVLALLLRRIDAISRRLDALAPKSRDVAAMQASGQGSQGPAGQSARTLHAAPGDADPPVGQRGAGHRAGFQAQPIPGAAAHADVGRPDDAAPAPGRAWGERQNAPRRARIDLELRFGRRWAAYLGGGVIAFGLALLVRHSIQQGYFPPAIRLAGAALLSLVFCAAAEVFRRRGTFATTVDAGLARRAADIPSILLGTGLAGVFAVAYATYAVYGYVGATPAFAVMASVALSGIAASLVYGPALAVLGYLAAQGVPFLVGGGVTGSVSAYAALVGVAGYAATYRGGWRRLENPAGAILLLWAWLLRGEPLSSLALVALSASVAAIAITVLRLRPRAAWGGWRQSLRACLALGLVAGHGFLLTSHVAAATDLPVHAFAATALGFAVLLVAFAFAATATRARAMGPVLAAAIVGAMAVLGARASDNGLSHGGVALTFVLISAAVLAVAAAALHRASRRSPITGLVGAASAAILLAAGDLVLWMDGAIDHQVLAGLSVLQGLGLIAAARPRGGFIPPSRQFASAAAASAGVGLLGFAVAASGLGDGPLTTLVLALTGAGAAGLAVAWSTPLFASIAGVAALPVLLHAGIDAVRTVLSVESGDGTALWPILENTLLPGLVLGGTVALLGRRVGAGAVREADRRWLSLVGATSLAPREGPAVSFTLAASAAGILLLAALVAVIRWIAYGDAYAPLSAPADLGLACAFALSGSTAALRLHRATSLAGLRSVFLALSAVAALLLGAALLLNPFLTGAPVGALPLLNLLVLAYLLPAVSAWRLARSIARPGAGQPDATGRGLAGGMAVAGLLGYATFAVSQVFQGPVLSFARVEEAELWTYTAVWLLLGTAILAYGIRFGTRVLRLTALGIVATVAAKVVLIDLSDLTGAARAASVIALGLVLLGIGMAYQRLTGAEERA